MSMIGLSTPSTRSRTGTGWPVACNDGYVNEGELVETVNGSTGAAWLPISRNTCCPAKSLGVQVSETTTLLPDAIVAGIDPGVMLAATDRGTPLVCRTSGAEGIWAETT